MSGKTLTHDDLIQITGSCPFCGCTPEDNDEGCSLLNVTDIGDRVAVTCSVCGCRGPWHVDDEAKAVEAWNNAYAFIRAGEAG